jgi:OOP family OmpA-OmpF porin
LTSDAEQILDDIIESLQPYPTLKLEISAHTDNQGNDKANEQLSIARARAVAAYFIRSGIAIDRITARAFGESSPIAPNNTAEGRRENRRVELRVLNDS